MTRAPDALSGAADDGEYRFCPACCCVVDGKECAACQDAEGGCPTVPIHPSIHQHISDLVDACQRLDATNDALRASLRSIVTDATEALEEGTDG